MTTEHVTLQKEVGSGLYRRVGPDGRAIFSTYLCSHCGYKRLCCHEPFCDIQERCTECGRNKGFRAEPEDLPDDD